MKLIKKAAPRRLARAILALTGRSGNKVRQTIQPAPVINPNHSRETTDRISDEQDHLQLRRRTTITVETETLLLVRSKRESSRVSPESEDEI